MISPLEFSIMFTLKIMEFAFAGLILLGCFALFIYLLFSFCIFLYRKHFHLDGLNCSPQFLFHISDFKHIFDKDWDEDEEMAKRR